MFKVTAERSVDSMRTRLKKLIKSIRQAVAEEKKAARDTGGGPYKPTTHMDSIKLTGPIMAFEDAYGIGVTGLEPALAKRASETTEKKVEVRPLAMLREEVSDQKQLRAQELHDARMSAFRAEYDAKMRVFFSSSRRMC